MAKVALVVDDSMLIRYSICRFLEDRGFAVEAASDGSEALEVLNRVQPDLIVTDMKMPKLSGGELMAALKGKPQTASVPIIVITSKANGPCDLKFADFTIFKDIDIETQLDKALDGIPGMTHMRGQAAN